MTIILAIDTSTDRTSVGIIENGELIIELHHDDPIGHGAVLPGLVKDALARENKIDHVAIGMGPGPFTGLRVGIAFGQCFATARNIPWIGVDSLAALATEHDDAEFIVAIDGRRREFFASHYVAGKLLAPSRVMQRESLVELSIPVYYGSPKTSAIADLSLTQASILEPIYIRKPDAYPAPKDVKFRLWLQTDLVNIFAIEKDVFGKEAWTMAQLKEEYAGKDRQRLVAEINGEVIGYAGALKLGEVTDILTLTVKPEFRRRGIAREFLKRLIDWSRNQKVEAVMLEMRKGNIEAEPLYLANGFRHISQRPNYYGHGVDAIIMRKELT